MSVDRIDNTVSNKTVTFNTFASGSAALPSVRFTADTDTGFFLKATGEVGLSVGGTEVAVFTSDGFIAKEQKFYFWEEVSDGVDIALGSGNGQIRQINTFNPTDPSSVFSWCDAKATGSFTLTAGTYEIWCTVITSKCGTYSCVYVYDATGASVKIIGLTGHNPADDLGLSFQVSGIFTLSQTSQIEIRQNIGTGQSTSGGYVVGTDSQNEVYVQGWVKKISD